MAPDVLAMDESLEYDVRTAVWMPNPAAAARASKRSMMRASYRPRLSRTPMMGSPLLAVPYSAATGAMSMATAASTGSRPSA